MTKPSIESTLADVCFYLGCAAHKANVYADAEGWYKKALALTPHNHEIDLRLAFPLALQRKYDEAIVHLTEAAKIESNRVTALYSRALIHLAKGNYYQGFKDMEWRLALPSMQPTIPVGFQRWEGQPCDNLHVAGEQGFGDIFMFSRYIPLIQEKYDVKKVYFEVQDSCVDILKYTMRHAKGVEVVGSGKHIAIDYTCHAISLARIMETTIDAVPPIKIEVSPEHIEKWRALRGSVGVCYTGRPNDDNAFTNQWNEYRNLPMAEVNKALDGRTIVCLQRELNPAIKSWNDVAGIMMNCDLIVTCDTGHAHLAAALGCETVLLNNYQSCWRWTMDQDNTPWYGDNLTILRQEKEFDWSAVFSQLQAYLANRKVKDAA